MTRFLQASWLSFKGTNAIYSGEEFLMLQIIQPLSMLIFYVLLASYSFSPNDLTRWIVGNSFLMCINTTIFSLGSTFNQERFYGRLRAIVVSPTKTIEVVIQKCFFPSIISIIVVLIGLFTGSLLFNSNLSLNEIPSLVIVLFISMLAASAFGMFISTFGLISDSMHLVLNFIGSGIVILSGANFPVEQLPRFAQLIAKALPIRNGLNASYTLLEPGSGEVSRFIISEFLICIFYLIGTMVVFRVLENKAKHKATLEIF